MRVEWLTCPLSSSPFPMTGFFLSSFPGTGSLLSHQAWDGAAVLLWEFGSLSYPQDVSGSYRQHFWTYRSDPYLRADFPRSVPGVLPLSQGKPASPFQRVRSTPPSTFFPRISLSYPVTVKFLALASFLVLRWWQYLFLSFSGLRTGLLHCSVLPLSAGLLSLLSSTVFLSQQPGTPGAFWDSAFPLPGQETENLMGPCLRRWFFATGLLGRACWWRWT